MSNKTKAVNLTEDEIAHVLSLYGYRLENKNFTDEDIERINYLNRRLKAFKEPDKEPDEAPQETETAKQDAKATAATHGWGKTDA